MAEVKDNELSHPIKTLKIEDCEEVYFCSKFFSKKILDLLYSQGIEAWVAGGAVRDYFLGDAVTNDIDVYFGDNKQFQEAVKVFENLEKDMTGRAPKKVVETPHSVKYEYMGVIIDFVSVIAGKPRYCLSTFDFTVCAAAVDREKMVYHKDFFMHLANKKLALFGQHTPLTSLARLQKYIQKGFRIDGDNLVALAKLLKDIDFEDPEQNTLEYYGDGTPRSDKFFEENFK